MADLAEKYRVPIGFSLLMASWLALLVTGTASLALAGLGFVILLYGFSLRRSTGRWVGLGTDTPAEIALTIGFWATLLGSFAYKHLLDNQLDTGPTSILLVAILQLPWSNDSKSSKAS